MATLAPQESWFTVGDLPAEAEVSRTREKPRFSDSLHLVALPTAAPVTRLFVAETLRKWSAMFIEPDMEAVAGELVAFSVKQTGPADVVSYRDITEPHLIRLRLLGYQRHITFEVIDEHDEALVVPEDAELPEDSGLALVDARAGRWGSHLTQHGRVMWAELGVYEQSAVGLPRRPVKPTPVPRRSSPPEPATQEFDLLRRVRAGLENMYPSR